MIGLYVSIGRQRGKRFEIAKERVTIGSDASNDLVLRDGGVAPFHGALVHVRNRWFLSTREADAFSSNRMRALEDGARLQVGDYTIVLAAAARGAKKPARLAAGTPVEPMPAQRPAEASAEPRPARRPTPAPEPQAQVTARSAPPVPEPQAQVTARSPALTLAERERLRAQMEAMMSPELAVPTEPLPPTEQPAPARDPVEQSLIDAIVGGDEAGRLVYADWLEGRGDTLRAEFLRLQRALDGMQPTDPAQYDLLKDRLRRLGELAPRIDFAWRRMLGRPVVEGCRRVVTDFQCKMDWGSLAPTERPNVRRCNGCGDDVYYVTTIRAAREHVRVGHCIAVDFKQERRPNDLEGEDPIVAMRTPRAVLPFFPFPQE